VIRYQTVIRMIDAMSTDLMTNLAVELERNKFAALMTCARRAGCSASFGTAMGPKVERSAGDARSIVSAYRVSRMTEKAGRVLGRCSKLT